MNMEPDKLIIDEVATDDDIIKKAMSAMGKRSIAKRKQDPALMTSWGKQAAAARWKNHIKKSKIKGNG